MTLIFCGSGILEMTDNWIWQVLSEKMSFLSV